MKRNFIFLYFSKIKPLKSYEALNLEKKIEKILKKFNLFHLI